jgi:hypothetical protein
VPNPRLRPQLQNSKNDQHIFPREEQDPHLPPRLALSDPHSRNRRMPHASTYANLGPLETLQATSACHFAVESRGDNLGADCPGDLVGFIVHVIAISVRRLPASPSPLPPPRYMDSRARAEPKSQMLINPLQYYH